MDDRWGSIVVPILMEVAKRSSLQFVTIGELAESLNVEPGLVLNEVERLISSEYIDSELSKMMTGGDVRPWFFTARLGERGARAIGIWPSEDQFESLLKLIDERIQVEGDTGRRSTLLKFRDALVAMGSSTASTLLTAWIQGQLGLH